MASENPPPAGPGAVRWPDRGQLLRQCGLLTVVILVWSGAFYGAMHLPTSGGTERSAAAEARREARRAAATPDSTTATPAIVQATPGAPETVPGDGPRPGPEEAPSTAAAEATPTPAAPASPSATPATATSDRTAQAAPPAAEPSPPTAEPSPPGAPPPPTPLDAPSRGDVRLEEMVLDPLAEADAAGEELGEVSFAADVFPILERRCVKCHGGLRDDGTQRIEEGLSLLTVDAILAGSTWGRVLEPGDVAGSYLYELVDEGDMPDNEPRLLPRELRLIAAWIRAGAPNN